MKLRIHRFASACSLLVVAGLAAGSPAAAKELQTGDDAPDFSLKASDGKTYSLDDFKGKQAVVIAWFPKAFTPGCTKECKSMQADGKALREFDVAYFTASVDTPEENAKFAKSLDLDYPILSDPSKKAAEAFGVVNKERNVAQRWTFYIDKEGKILEIDKQVRTEQHGKDIAEKLQELGVDKKE
jgi:thioredoxin-dependent peroxiredoxin